MSTFPPSSVKSLRKFAELNLCPDCYPKYLALIEPQVERMALDSLYYWRMTESLVTQMVMKQEGVFKSRSVFLSLDEGESSKFADQVDYRVFRRISRWSFSRKNKYLHDNGSLP